MRSAKTSSPISPKGGGRGAASYEHERLALPAAIEALCPPEATLSPEHLKPLIGPPDLLLNSSDSTASALYEADIDTPHVDAAFKSPKVYGKFISRLLKLNIIDIVDQTHAYLGVFLFVKQMAACE